MINWLHTLPNAMVALIVISCALSCTTVIPYLLRRRTGWEPAEPLAKGAEEAFKLFTSLTMLLLAFCLVRVQGDHRNVEDLVSREAAVIIKMNRSLIAYGADEAEVLRISLKDYLKSAVEVEWPLLAKAQRSEETAAMMLGLIQDARTLEPVNAPQQLARAEILGTLTQLADLREARLSASRLALPDYYWQAIGMAFCLLTFFGVLQSPLPKMLAYVGGVTLGVSLMMTMLIATEGVFVGESRVTPEPIVNVMSMLGE
jgi:Protein of unknown function (DUF4239)